MAWYEKRLADGRVALRPNGGIQEFKEVFEAFAETKPGAAVFYAANDDDAGASLILTPQAEEFARMIQATQIPRPYLERLIPLFPARLAHTVWTEEHKAALKRLGFTS